MPRPLTIPIALAGALVGLGPCAPGTLAADPSLLYLREDAAVAVDAAVGGGTLRQAPAAHHARWGSAHLVGKVRGTEIEGKSAARIAAVLRAGWRHDGAGGRVAVDEITPARWTAAGAARLGRALALLGPAADRVVFYAAPSLVERVGRVDPRRALPPRLACLVAALSRGRATYLLTYRGDGTPFPAREMAVHPTRWAARWPAGRGELRVMLGADTGAGQAELWARVRSTPAGRAMLARGPGAYGLAAAAAGRDWVAQYRAFLAAPSVSATGVDYAVPPRGASPWRAPERGGCASPSRGGAARSSR
jgi:hypothetical protein